MPEYSVWYPAPGLLFCLREGRKEALAFGPGRRSRTIQEAHGRRKMFQPEGCRRVPLVTMSMVLSELSSSTTASTARARGIS